MKFSYKNLLSPIFVCFGWIILFNSVPINWEEFYKSFLTLDENSNNLSETTGIIFGIFARLGLGFILLITTIDFIRKIFNDTI